MILSSSCDYLSVCIISMPLMWVDLTLSLPDIVSFPIDLNCTNHNSSGGDNDGSGSSRDLRLILPSLLSQLLLLLLQPSVFSLCVHIIPFVQVITVLSIQTFSPVYKITHFHSNSCSKSAVQK